MISRSRYASRRHLYVYPLQRCQVLLLRQKPRSARFFEIERLDFAVLKLVAQSIPSPTKTPSSWSCHCDEINARRDRRPVFAPLPAV
jgi:hypothetical protein